MKKKNPLQIVNYYSYQDLRSIRGGTWTKLYGREKDVRVSNRDYFDPSSSVFCGLRLCRTVTTN